MPSEYHGMAERLFQLVPPALSPSTYEEYGLEIPHQNRKAITRHILALTLYWIDCALRVSLKDIHYKHIFEEVCHRIREQWEDSFELDKNDVRQFFEELIPLHADYKKMSREGGQPIDVLQKAVTALEGQGLIRHEDQQSTLALFVDFIPVDEVGEVVAEIEAELG